MKKTRSALALCLTVLYFFTFIHFGAMAQVSVPSEWKSVQILGGGFVPGLIYSETQKDLLYARTEELIGGMLLQRPGFRLPIIFPGQSKLTLVYSVWQQIPQIRIVFIWPPVCTPSHGEQLQPF
jgi:hypothetical protein